MEQRIGVRRPRVSSGGYRITLENGLLPFGSTAEPVSAIDCPSCPTDSGTETDRAALEEVLQKTFECEHCGYAWNVIF